MSRSFNLTDKAIVRGITSHVRRRGGHICGVKAPWFLDSVSVFAGEGLASLVPGMMDAKYEVTGLEQVEIGDRRRFKRLLRKGHFRRRAA